VVKVTLKDGRDITISEPKGKHLRLLPDLIEAGDNQTLVAFKLISVLSTPTLLVCDIDELPGADAIALLNALSTFQLDGVVRKG
jgi:hypothetical protein